MDEIIIIKAYETVLKSKNFIVRFYGEDFYDYLLQLAIEKPNFVLKKMEGTAFMNQLYFQFVKKRNKFVSDEGVDRGFSPKFDLMIDFELLITKNVPKLSRREIQVYELYMKGYGTKEIANELGISRENVRRIKSFIVKKLRKLNGNC